MKETIIKLLKSNIEEDRAIGVELLKKEYYNEIFRNSHLEIEILNYEDLNNILETNVFTRNSANLRFHDFIIISRNDMYSFKPNFKV